MTLHNELYSTSELAEILRVSRKTVTRMVARGQLPFYRFGRTKRFRLLDVENFLDECRQIVKN